MSGHDDDPASGPDELAISRVLRAAGGRIQPSAEMQAQVRQAVHAQWSEVVGQRRRRRQRVWLAAAASVALAAVGVVAVRTQLASPTAVVANVSHSIGEVRSKSGRWSTWQTAAVARPIHDGDVLATGADGHAALALAEGVSLRLDHDTRIAFGDAEHVEVLAGAVYVDSGGAARTAGALEILTPAGAVRHVGTQYEVRLVGAGTRIRVREGAVELRPDSARKTYRMQAGEQATVSGTGDLARATIATSGSEWAWVLRAAPPFDIDGRRVRDFLEWAGRELGRELVFETAESEAEADRAVLSGSTAGLTPSEAISAVLPTTRLRSVERGDQLVIALSP